MKKLDCFWLLFLLSVSSAVLHNPSNFELYLTDAPAPNLQNFYITLEAIYSERRPPELDR